MKSMTTQPNHRNAKQTESISANALNGLIFSHQTITFFQYGLPPLQLTDSQVEGTS